MKPSATGAIARTATNVRSGGRTPIAGIIHALTLLVLSGVQPQPMKVLFNSGFVDRIGLDNVCANIDATLIRARSIVGG